MSALGFLIGTGILWLLEIILVHPLAMLFTKVWGLESQQVITEENGEQVSTLVPSTGVYIFTDVIVLGIAGFVLGVTVGWFFIGITWKPTGWPGMIVFICLSLLGSSIHG